MECWRHGRPAAHAPTRSVCLTAPVAIAPLDKRRDERRKGLKRKGCTEVLKYFEAEWETGVTAQSDIVCQRVCVCVRALVIYYFRLKEWKKDVEQQNSTRSPVTLHLYWSTHSCATSRRSAEALQLCPLTASACITGDRNGIVWVSPLLSTSSCVADKTEKVGHR